MHTPQREVELCFREEEEQRKGGWAEGGSMMTHQGELLVLKLPLWRCVLAEHRDHGTEIRSDCGNDKLVVAWSKNL